MTELHVITQSEAYVGVIQALLEAPQVAPRGMKVREVADRVSVVIARPQAGFVNVQGRKLNHAITAIEGCSLVGQVSVPEAIIDRVGAFAPYANDGIFWGAYGSRIAGDLGQLVNLLQRDPDSRQAVLSIFDSDRDLGRQDLKDVPCTVAIQFFVRNDEHPMYSAPALNMWVVMRSNDAWLGLPYDLGQFSLLQFAVANALGVRVGTYTHSVGSMHLYERNWEDAEKVTDPQTTPLGHTFGLSSIEDISSRCRRILLGQGVPHATNLERWLVDIIGPFG